MTKIHQFFKNQNQIETKKIDDQLDIFEHKNELKKVIQPIFCHPKILVEDLL